MVECISYMHGLPSLDDERGEEEKEAFKGIVVRKGSAVAALTLPRLLSPGWSRSQQAVGAKIVPRRNEQYKNWAMKLKREGFFLSTWIRRVPEIHTLNTSATAYRE